MRSKVLGLAIITAFASPPLMAGDAPVSTDRIGQVTQQDQNTTGKSSGHAKEDVHAPTNRVGEAVPKMTKEPDSPSKQPSAGSTDKRDEAVHAPTNRIGKTVPEMTPDSEK